MRKVKFSVSVKNFQNDMLWRLWISDSSYLKHNNLGIFVSKEDAGDCFSHMLTLILGLITSYCLANSDMLKLGV